MEAVTAVTGQRHGAGPLVLPHEPEPNPAGLTDLLIVNSETQHGAWDLLLFQSAEP